MSEAVLLDHGRVGKPGWVCRARSCSLRSADVQAELHVWPGGFHGFDVSAPDSVLGKAMISTRDAWVGRLLGG